MKNADFKRIYSLFKEKFDAYSEEVFLSVKSKSNLADAMKYSFTAGGKRVRPVLMLYFADLLGVEESEIMPFAFSLECLHTYSLIHDDLPALDNDTLRRGKPTSHVKFGEATAILAGDALLNFAFEHALYHCDNKNKISALSYLAACSGYGGMLEGQSLDIKYEKSPDITEEVLFDIIERKTAKFIEAATVIPAILSGREIFPYEEFGRNFGRLFQFCDDLSDVISTKEKMGKSIGKDDLEDKPSAVKVYGADSLKDKIQNLANTCKSIANNLDKSGFLQCFTDYVIGNEKA